MKRNLSISRAWDETKARIAADGRLFVAVALALIALPTAVGQFVSPGSGGVTNPPAGLGETLLALVVMLISVTGQLALIRLALGPPLSVGQAIGHGARRLPAYVGAAILLLLALFLLMLPFGLALTAIGVSLESATTAPPASAWLLLLLFLVVAIYLGTRMLMTSPVASAEDAGPIAIIRRSWRLTAGNTGRLLGFVLLFLLAALVVVAAVTVVVNSVVTAALGAPEPRSVAALIVALVSALLSALATMLFIVMITRIYVQLAGEGAEVTVPTTGH